MRLDDLRQELRALASDAPATESDAATVVRPAVRRIRLRAALAGATAVVVVLGGVAVINRVNDRHKELSITSPTGPSTRSGLSAENVADGQWSAMAPAPLTARNHASVVWAGTQLIVWGGDDGQHVFDDGAAYDPGADTWRRLPPAPIAARTLAAAVWTGREVIIWGGDRKFVGDYAADGAAFDPSTWTWRTIGAAPLAPRYSADMVWTGREMIVMGGAESNTDTVTSVLDAAAYDPATNRWQSIARLPGVDNAIVEGLRFAWTGNELLVWEQWRRTAGSLTTFGLQLVSYDPKADAWRHAPPSDDPHRNVVSPLWTGNEIVSPAFPPLCDLPDGAQNCGPPPTNLHGDTFDPASNTWRSMPHGPADDGVSASVWIGDALVVVSSGVIDGATGKQLVAVGISAEWSPRTNAWTRLARAPVLPDAPTAFWTGNEILVWGSERGGLRYGRGPTTHATTPAPTTTTANVPPKPIALPAITQIADMQPAVSASFPWGSGVGAVGYRPSNDQADDGAGPAVSSVDGDGNVYVFDQVNWRIVVRRAAVTSYALDAPTEGVYAAVFDAKHRLIVAGTEHFLVFAPDGRLEGKYPRSRFADVADLQFLSLQVRGPDVVGYLSNTERVVLTDRGRGYLPRFSAPVESAAVRIDVNAPAYDSLTLTAATGAADFDVHGPDQIVYVPATRVLPDGSIVAVLKVQSTQEVASSDVLEPYVLIRLRPDGTAEFATFSASEGRMSNPSGPVFVAGDDAVSVLSSSSTTGAAVTRYRYADLPAAVLATARTSTVPGPYGFRVPSDWTFSPLANFGGPASFARWVNPDATGEVVEYERSGGEFGVIYNRDGSPNLPGALQLAGCPIATSRELSSAKETYTCAGFQAGPPSGFEMKGVIVVLPPHEGWLRAPVSLPLDQDRLASGILDSVK